MEKPDWKSFTVRIPVKASAEKLFTCWATRAGMEYWFLRLSDYKDQEGKSRQPDEMVQKGDRYRWLWHGWPDETVEEGTILDTNGRDFLQFSFGKAGNCSVRIIEENDQMLVELTQDQIPDDETGRQIWHLGCKTGWTFYFANLKSLLEGGIDLRNRDENLKNVINS